MTDLTNSRSLTDFQRNARSCIEGLNETKKPMLLTINGKVQAILIDPASYQSFVGFCERRHFMDALRDGERAIEEGRVRTAAEAYQEMKSRYDF